MTHTQSAIVSLSGVFSLSGQRRASVALLLWCVGLLTYLGYLISHASVNFRDKSAFGMLWNLFLAVVPWLWSSAFDWANVRKSPALAGLFFFLWLLFLPNAPYLITDLLHLKPSHAVPLWYLLATLVSCAGAGTLLGYLSLSQVQSVITQTWSKTAGWAVAAGSLLLSGFGIYLGRYLHWNSWDVFVHPTQMVRDIHGQFRGGQFLGVQFPHPGSHPPAVAVTLVYGIGLLVGYLVWHAFSPMDISATDRVSPSGTLPVAFETKQQPLEKEALEKEALERESLGGRKACKCLRPSNPSDPSQTGA